MVSHYIAGAVVPQVQISVFSISSILISLILTFSSQRQPSLILILCPLNLPVSFEPPETTIVGILTPQAPIIILCMVLSHSPNKTTPSRGSVRIGYYVSMLVRFRNNITVGFIIDSPSNITGNSRGNHCIND
ncbi:MAG: hypothetical protein M3R50_10860 [Bacteroidota bacterium]|nr:hypothetical protein [Bacteroidota bacterium]